MTGGSGAASSSSAPKGPKKKKSAVATARKLRVNPSPSGEPEVGQGEVIPADRPKLCVPAMPKSAPAKAELHRPELRGMIKQKIQELEFKVVLELFSAVARLVPKDEVRKNPKAKAALDKEWENLRTKGVWDESRVRECKSIVDEARRTGETVHLGRIFEACFEKGSELPADDPRRKFKGIQFFRAIMSATKTQTTLCSLNSAVAPPQWKQPSCSMPLGHSPVSPKPKLMRSKHIFRPSLLVCPLGFLCHGTGGQSIGPKNSGSRWFLWS